MNRKVTECDIVLELLPLYIEQKTSGESNAFVAEHLAGCEECREAYEFMSADLMSETGVSVKCSEMGAGAEYEETEHANREAVQDHKETSQKHLSPTTKKVLLVTGGILAYLGLMVGLVIYTFMYLTGM